MNIVCRISVIFLFFYCSNLISQQKTDSLFAALKTSKEDTNKVSLLFEIIRTIGLSDDKTLNYIQEAEILSKKLNYLNGERAAVGALGNYVFMRGNYNDAIDYYKRGIDLSKRMGIEKDEADMMMGIGLCYYATSDLEKSLLWNIKALEMRERIKDSLGISSSYIHLSNISQYRGDLETAKNYLLKSLEIKKRLNDKGGQIFCLGNLGNIYGTKKDYDKALDHFMQSLKLSRELNSTSSISNCLGNIGSVYEYRGDFKTALKYYNESLLMEEQAGNRAGIASTFLNIAGLYAKTGDFVRAVAFYEKSEKVSEEIGSLDDLQIIYSSLSELYHIKKDDAKAYFYLKKHIQIKDSILNIENQESLNRLQELYQSEKKDKELLTKDMEIERKKTENNRQKLFSIFVALVLLLVGAFSIVLFNRFKLTKKQKRIIEVKQKEILDSIKYAQRIQRSLLPTEKYIERNISKNTRF